MLDADPIKTGDQAEEVQVRCTNETEDVTATVTAGGGQSAGAPPTVTEFMSAVVAWPTASRDPGWVVLQPSYALQKTKDGRGTNGKFPIGKGKSFKDVSSALGYANWITTKTQKDVWFCTSLQEKVGTDTKRNKPVGARSKQDALLLKSIWLDIDVKPNDPNNYGTLEEALKALFTFQKQVALPAPSAIVFTGRGIHVYWINKTAMDPQTWRPYPEGLKQLALTHGLKADTGLMTNEACLLRVPGTFNHKLTTPRPVQLAPGPLVLYDFATDLAMLKSFAGPVAAAPTASTPFNPFAEGVDPAIFRAGPDPKFKGIREPGLDAGIDKFSDHLVAAEPIFRQCRFFKEALKTGGANFNQPLWNYSVLGATFMENGNAIAHAISKGHAEYTEVDTQALWDRKMAERARGGLGYPGCAAIEGAGCKSCAMCPLRTKGKSPLNIRPVVTATVTNASSPSGSSGQTNWTGRSGISFSNIPHRKWLYGSDLVRGETTVIGSPGGAGKSSLAIGMAICAATDREVLQEKIRGNNLKALVINGEDSSEEIRRRVYAFCLAHGIAERDLHGLTVVGADDAWVQRISFLTTNEKGASALNQSGLDALQLALDALHPDVIVLDPLVSFCGGGNMNDNAVMSLAMRKLKEIAARYECAVLIVHHTRKGGDAGNVETISGAAAITNLARRAIMPAPLTDDDIKRHGILPSERPQYFKLVDAKSNLVPRAADSPLYRLQSVELPNPEPPLYPNGDYVQAITRVVLPIQPSGAASADDMKIEGAIFALVDRGKEIDGQFYPYSASPAGAKNLRPLMPDATIAVANATAPRQWPRGDLEAVIRSAIEKMKTDGRIVEGELKDIAPDAQKRFRKGRGLKAVPI